MAPDPTIEAVAPLRISFVGGGTDFPHWYEEHGGAVLSATIDHVVRVRVTERSDRVVAVRHRTRPSCLPGLACGDRSRKTG